MSAPALSNAVGVLLTRSGEGVAESLRNMILRGDLKDGDMLPRQQDLAELFHVSHPSLREGLRILEAEGLIVIRRGKHGGAVVQAPKAAGVAYHLGLVLQTEKVQLADVAMAMQELEPVCYGIAAANPDRSAALVPELIESSNQLEENIEADGETYTNLSREFHTLVILHCGNSTVQVVLGALTKLWSMQEDKEAKQSGYNFHPTVGERLEVLALHRRLIDLINRNQVEECVDLARKHYADNGRYGYWHNRSSIVDVSSLPFTSRNAE
jgi:GntR family transcriptional regulator, transcriptional repressor for pyruvate dehydrogenase complex